MARNETIEVGPGEWVQLTAGDAAAITLQIQRAGTTAWIKGTEAATAPTNLSGAIFVEEMGMGYENKALADLWPGISAARVWAWSERGTRIFVSHA